MLMILACSLKSTSDLKQIVMSVGGIRINDWVQGIISSVGGTSITDHGILSLAKLTEYSENLEEFDLEHDDKDELKSIDMLRTVLNGKGMKAVEEYACWTKYRKE